MGARRDFARKAKKEEHPLGEGTALRPQGKGHSPQEFRLGSTGEPLAPQSWPLWGWRGDTGLQGEAGVGSEWTPPGWLCLKPPVSGEWWAMSPQGPSCSLGSELRSLKGNRPPLDLTLVSWPQGSSRAPLSDLRASPPLKRGLWLPPGPFPGGFRLWVWHVLDTPPGLCLRTRWEQGCRGALGREGGASALEAGTRLK